MLIYLCLEKWQFLVQFMSLSKGRPYIHSFEIEKFREGCKKAVSLKSSACKCSNEKGSSWIGSSKEAAFIIKCRNNVLNFQKISNQTKQAISMWKINLNIDFAGIKNLLRQNLWSQILLRPELFKSEMEQFFEGYLFSS